MRGVRLNSGQQQKMEVASVIFASCVFGAVAALVKRANISSLTAFAIGYAFALLCVLVAYEVSEKVVSLTVPVGILLLLILPCFIGGLLAYSKHEAS